MIPVRYRSLLLCLAIVCAGFGAHGIGIKNGFIWDDDVYVIGNEHLRTHNGLKQIWFNLDAEPQYYPMTHTTFWLEYHLWQLNPAGYHFDNILLHSINALLVWIIMAALGVPLPWLVALIFAVHPVQVESVAWITERKNVLSTFFYLLSFWAYIKFLHLDSPHTAGPSDSLPAGERNAHHWMLYGLCFVLFLLALTSKTVTCSLPAAILVLIWWKRHRITLKQVLLLLPFFAAGLIMGLTTAWIEKNHLGAQGEEWALSFIERVLVAGRALWFYCANILWPHDLAFFYERWQVNSGVWWQYLFPVAILGIFGGCYALRKRFGKGPFVAIMLFSGTLLPAIGFVNVYPHRFSFVADHFQYLASIPMLALICSGFFWLRQKAGQRYHTLFAVLAMVAVVSLGVQSHFQTAIYQNLETLWQDTLQKTPSSWMAHNNLGTIKEQQGDLAGAVECYRKAIKIRPRFDFAHFNLGRVYFRQGKTDLAIKHYRQVLHIDKDYSKMHPKARPSIQADTHHNLAHIYESQGEMLPAIQHYQAAIALNPYPYKACNALGNLYFRRGNLSKAGNMYLKSLSINPQYAKAHNGMGVVYLTQKQFQKAIDHFSEALRIKPNYHNAKRNMMLAKNKLASQ